MENVRIQTTQNVDIEYQLASVADRIVSTLIDFMFMGCYLLLFGIIMAATNNFSQSPTVAVIAFLPIMLYNIVCETFLQGRSFGKMLMKLQVVKLDGAQAGFGNYLLRWLLRPIDIFFWGVIAMITIILNGKGQRLGDLAAGTTVIKLKYKTTIKDTILKSIVSDYTIVFTNVSLLSDNDIAIIKDVLAFCLKWKDRETLQKLAVKTQQVMGITTELTPRKFIDTVIADYTHFHFDK